MIIGMVVSVYLKILLNLLIMNQASGVLKFPLSNAILDFIKQAGLLQLMVHHAKNAILYPLTKKKELAHSAGNYQA
jgi:hypothetical protein